MASLTGAAPVKDTFDLDALWQELIRDEGLVLHVYKDPGSGRAIGVGRNLDTQGLSGAEMEVLGLQGLEGNLRGDAVVLKLAAVQPITEAQAALLLDNDIRDRCHQLDAFAPWWRLLSPVRQRVILNMAFEMGTRGMLTRMADALGLVQLGRFNEAADAMELSAWGKAVPKRPHEMAQMMRLDKAVDRAGNPV